MNLREYLRNEWSQYIRPIMVKDECEFCGSKEELHLHHIDRFHNMLVETLEELQLQELDTEHYDEMELKMISNFMLATQIKSEYKTLCKTCHMKLHAKEKFTDEYKNHYYNPNGKYIMINKEYFLKNEIPLNHLFRFLYLASFINYDGYITDKTKRRNNKLNINEINDKLLQVSRTEYFRFRSFLKDYDLMQIDEVGVKLNKNVVTKGLNNYKHKVKIFIDPMENLYNSVENTGHKFMGLLLLISLKSDYGFLKCTEKEILEVLGLKNITRVREEIKTKYKDVIKIIDNGYLFNPNLIHFGALDYSYKNIIEKWNKNKS